MDIPTLRPRALRPGDTIGIIAPAGPICEPRSLDQGIHTLQRLGFQVHCEDRVLETRGYLAGEDSQRAEELLRYFADPHIQAILALRGGYGCSRLIPLISHKLHRAHCKIFMGFSDLTTLHLFMTRRLGWVTFHGPMATSLALVELKGEAEKHLVSLWSDPAYHPALTFPELETWSGGVAEGKLVGGCLSILVTSLGTPYEIQTEGRILFLEDLGEAPYRVDRMLTHLRLAGKLEGVMGILLGRFQDCTSENSTVTVNETLRDILQPLGVPILANFRAGHGPENWAIPLGVRVRIDAERKSLELLDSAVH